MGVAAQNLPIGERQLLHISHLGSYKGFDNTCASILGVDTLLHVASPSIQADVGLLNTTINGENLVFNFMGTIDNNDPECNQWIVDNCDFYIHTATMDAQATTVLENGARGLIPLVTPESGFACPDAIYLTHSPEENRQIIEWALNLPESELLQRSHLIREYIERKHSWENIYNRIWDGIMADIASRSEKK